MLNHRKKNIKGKILGTVYLVLLSLASFCSAAELNVIDGIELARREVPFTCGISGFDRKPGKIMVYFFDRNTFMTYMVGLDSFDGTPVERDMCGASIAGSTVVNKSAKEVTDFIFDRYSGIRNFDMKLEKEGYNNKRYKCYFDTNYYSFVEVIVNPATGAIVKEKIIYRH